MRSRNDEEDSVCRAFFNTDSVRQAKLYLDNARILKAIELLGPDGESLLLAGYLKPTYTIQTVALAKRERLVGLMTSLTNANELKDFQFLIAQN